MCGLYSSLSEDIISSIVLYTSPIVVIEKEREGRRKGIEFFASFANLKSAIEYPNMRKETTALANQTLFVGFHKNRKELPQGSINSDKETDKHNLTNLTVSRDQHLPKRR